MSRNRNRKRNRIAYRNHNAVQRTASDAHHTSLQKQDTARSKKQVRAMKGLDGYSNAAAFLGEDSDLLSAGTFLRSDLTAQTELLTTAV